VPALIRVRLSRCLPAAEGSACHPCDATSDHERRLACASPQMVRRVLVIRTATNRDVLAAWKRTRARAAESHGGPLCGHRLLGRVTGCADHGNTFLMVYVDRPSVVDEALGVWFTGIGGNVALLTPFNPVVFQRTATRRGITTAALSQVAADLLNSPAVALTKAKP
jgi:hypothetical protein